MKLGSILAAMGMALFLSSCATQNGQGLSDQPAVYSAEQAEAEATPGDPGWPRVFVNGTTTNIVYQPQIDSWNGDTLLARNAVAVQSAGQPKPTYGVIHVQATTLVDKTDRTVAVEGVQILFADFPSAPERTAEYLQSLREQFPKEFKAVSLDRLEASLAVTQQQQKAQAQQLDNTPPKIIISKKPAILVSVDGEPVYQPVSGTDLQRVINTRVFLLKDNAGHFYLHLLDGYMEADSLNGPWVIASQIPAGVPQAETKARESDQADMLEGQTDPDTFEVPSLKNGPPPDIYTATTPTELITFEGNPQFTPISGSHLLYASNTSGNVFNFTTTQQIYVLVSGRWYRSASLNGPWEFVPANALPSDFAQIPDSSPKENVKASVAGTPQAQEALIANTIPQTAKIERSTQMEDPQIDGQPQLQPIEGTPLFYVVNSATPIIKVNDQSWYACQDGIWYNSASVTGPWATATSVPAVIYSIPITSPLHYVTYVRVYNATPDFVYDGYTPGYMGTVVAPDDVVVYGTGYYYRPWIGTVWLGAPVTWGLGCDLAWTPWASWHFGFGFGWSWGYPRHRWGWHPPSPWWGPYHHLSHYPRFRPGAWGPGGWANSAGNVYRWHGHDRKPGIVAHPVPSESWRTHGQAYNSRTGALAAGQHARVGNVYRHPFVPGTTRTIDRGRIPARTPGWIPSNPNPQFRNNAFATPDGRVYQHNGSRPGNGWRALTPAPASNPRTPPSPRAPRVTPQPAHPPLAPPNLGRESVARGIGERRFDSFRMSRPPVTAPSTPRMAPSRIAPSRISPGPAVGGFRGGVQRGVEHGRGHR